MSRPVAILAVGAVVWAALTARAVPAQSPTTSPGGARIVALSAVRLPAELTDKAQARTLIDSLIRVQLAVAGVAVLPAEETRKVEREVSDSLGGIYDRITGRLDSARNAAWVATTPRLLRERHGAVLWLSPYVLEVTAPFDKDKASWHGQTENSGGQGALSKVLFVSYYGQLPALSLYLLGVNSSGKVVYARAGGIQLQRHLTSPAFDAPRYALVPRDSLLSSPTRLADAVRLATDSLLVCPCLKP